MQNRNFVGAHSFERRHHSCVQQVNRETLFRKKHMAEAASTGFYISALKLYKYFEKLNRTASKKKSSWT